MSYGVEPRVSGHLVNEEKEGEKQAIVTLWTKLSS